MFSSMIINNTVVPLSETCRPIFTGNPFLTDARRPSNDFTLFVEIDILRKPLTHARINNSAIGNYAVLVCLSKIIFVKQKYCCVYENTFSAQKKNTLLSWNIPSTCVFVFIFWKYQQFLTLYEFQYTSLATTQFNRPHSNAFWSYDEASSIQARPVKSVCNYFIAIKIAFWRWFHCDDYWSNHS